MKITRIELAGANLPGSEMPKAVAVVTRAAVGGCIYAYVYGSDGSTERIVFSPFNGPAAERRRYKAGAKLAQALDGEGGDAKAYLQVVETMMAMAAPAPAAETGNAYEDIEDAIRDSLSPEAVAAIAHAASEVCTPNWDVDRQVDWFAKTLRKMIGGEYDKMIEDLGLKK